METQQSEPGNADTRVAILLATPSYGDSFCGDYVHSVQKLGRWVQSNGHELKTLFLDYADIVAARNILTSLFLFSETDYTHLLFVDDDMGFSVDLVADAIAFDPGLCGAFYPKRRVDLAKLHGSGDTPFTQALAQSVGFIGEPEEPPRQNGRFVTARRIGTGFMLLSRPALADFVARSPELVHPTRYDRVLSPRPEQGWLTIFDRKIDQGIESSEDIAFCDRWRAAGGDIWAARDGALSHTGKIRLTSRYDEA